MEDEEREAPTDQAIPLLAPFSLRVLEIQARQSPKSFSSEKRVPPLHDRIDWDRSEEGKKLVLCLVRLDGDQVLTSRLLRCCWAAAELVVLNGD